MTRTQADLEQLRAQATALRRSGKSVRQIRDALGPVGNARLSEALRGVPPPGWTRRPRAKDGLRARARDLRRQGFGYEDIAAELGVAKSSISLWVRDLPVPPALSHEECRRRSAMETRNYWERERAAREERRASDRAAAAAEIGPLTEREILIAGAIAYWCEGAKRKPYRPQERVMFINSDPALIAFFVRFLETAGVARDDLIFRLYIHETADAVAARRFWLSVTGAAPGQFRGTVLKRHNPKTVRKNTGDDYHGCLRIDVRRSGELYRKIEGWASAGMCASRACSGCP